jgi:hypothetical protein
VQVPRLGSERAGDVVEALLLSLCSNAWPHSRVPAKITLDSWSCEEEGNALLCRDLPHQLFGTYWPGVDWSWWPGYASIPPKEPVKGFP